MELRYIGTRNRKTLFHEINLEAIKRIPSLCFYEPALQMILQFPLRWVSGGILNTRVLEICISFLQVTYCINYVFQKNCEIKTKIKNFMSTTLCQ